MRKRPNRRRYRRRYSGKRLLMLLAVALLLALSGQYAPSPAPQIECTAPRIIDGDTLDCAGTRIRLAGIDAPELAGHCAPGRKCTKGDPQAAKQHLISLTRQLVACSPQETDHYGRTIARCRSHVDLSCAMLDAGHAVRRYGYISCFLP